MSAADPMTALLPEHRRYLNDVAVSNAVIDAAGVYSVSKPDDLPTELRNANARASHPNLGRCSCSCGPTAIGSSPR